MYPRATATEHRVLLVEDDPDTAEALLAILSLQGICTQWVQSGSEAMQVCDALGRLSSPLPDVVLLDLVLPDMSGVELAKEFAAWPEPPAIVLLSAAPESMLEAAEREVSFDAVVRKPFSVDAFSRLVLALLATRAASPSVLSER